MRGARERRDIRLQGWGLLHSTWGTSVNAVSEASLERVGDITSSTATRALISRSALREAAAAAVSAGGYLADLRGDAYGHECLTVARAVVAAGATSVRVDDADTAAFLRGEG